MNDRVRFTPARNASGRAVADRYAGQVRWALPPPEPGEPAVRAWPVQNLARYVSDADYPRVAIDRNEEGRVEFIVEISPEGRATRCHIMVSSGSRLLDFRTCQIVVLRARFDPARDAAGNPVADVFGSAISWRLSW